MHGLHPVRQMDRRLVSTLVHVGWCLLHCMRRDCGARSHAARNARWIGRVGCSRNSKGCAWCVARRMSSSMGAGGRAPSPSVRRVAPVRRVTAAAVAACSAWTRALRCSTAWRYPAPKHMCARADSDARRGRCACAVRERLRTAAAADAARLCAERRHGFHVRRGSYIQGRHDHQHQDDGAHWA